MFIFGRFSPVLYMGYAQRHVVDDAIIHSILSYERGRERELSCFVFLGQPVIDHQRGNRCVGWGGARCCVSRALIRWILTAGRSMEGWDNDKSAFVTLEYLFQLAVWSSEESLAASRRRQSDSSRSAQYNFRPFHQPQPPLPFAMLDER